MKLLKKYTAIMAAFTMLTCISPDGYTQTETAIPVYAEMYDSAIPHGVSSVDGGEVAVSIDQIELTQEQVKALNYEIPLFVRMDRNPGINVMEFGVRADSELTMKIITNFSDAQPYVQGNYLTYIPSHTMMDAFFFTLVNERGMTSGTNAENTLAWNTKAFDEVIRDTGTLMLVVVTIPHDTIGNLTGGNVRDGYRYYDVAYGEFGDPSPDLYANDIDTPKDYSDSVEYHDGWVRVKMEEETTTSTTTTSTTTTTTATTTTTLTTPETTTTTTTTLTTPETTITTTETKPSLAVMENEITLEAGQQYQIEANQENLIYSSNNPEIAVVSSNGKITALTEGNAIITVINQDYDVSQIQVTVVSAEKIIYELGDTNHDTNINAKDAAEVLIHAANIGAGNEGTLLKEALIAADVNTDGDVNSKDVAEILVYAAVQGAGGTPSFSSQREPEETTETTITTETPPTETTTTATTTTKPAVTASIETESIRYNRTDQNLYFSFNCENVTEDSSAWFAVVPSDTPHSETDARNAYISAAYLHAQIGYAGFKIPAEKAVPGNYDLRIYDPDNGGIELDCVSFVIAEPLKAEILSDSVKASASSVSASFTTENLESNSNAWIGILPHETDSETPITKKKLTECSENSVEFSFSEKLSAGTYDICIYDPDNDNQKLSSVSFTILPEVTASVYNAYYSQSYNNVSFDVSAQNLTSGSQVWLAVVPASTSKTYSATYSARIKWDYLNNVIDKKIDTYDMTGVSAGNYELRICDPDRQTILSSDSFTVTTRKPPAISSCSINVEQGQYEGYTYTLNVSGTYDYYYVTCKEYSAGSSSAYTVFSNKKSSSSSLYLTAGSSLDRVTVSVTPYYSDGTSGDTVTRTAYQPKPVVPAWKSAYKSKLSSVSAGSGLEERRYSLYDLNKDGIPELFISDGEYHISTVDVYTYSEGSVVLVDTGWGQYGETLAYGSYLISEYSAPEYNSYYIATLQGTSMKKVAVLTKEYSGSSYKYTYNDSTITASKYNSYLSQYHVSSASSLGRTYSKTNTSAIDNY